MSWLLPLPPAADLSGFDLRLHVFPARLEVTQRGGPALLIITSHFPVLTNALSGFLLIKKSFIPATLSGAANACFPSLHQKEVNFCPG